jgi:PAS domain S-box-containing protein
MATVVTAPKEMNTARILLFFVFLTFGAIIVQTWLSIVEDRHLTLASEHKNGLVAVRLLEEHASQTLRDAERNLDAVSDAIAALKKGRVIDEALLRDIITQGKRDNRFLSALEFVNPQGVSLVSSIDYPAHQTDLDDRKYIPFLLKHTSHNRTVVGRSFMRFYDSELVVPLARNIHNKSGKFLGIISTDISVSYFTKVYGRVAVGSNALVALFADDGYVIVRSPFDERFLSIDISAAPVLKQLRAEAIEGNFEDDFFLGDVKSTPRLYTYRKIEDFAVTAVYARSREAILVDFRARTVDRIVYAAVFIFVHLILAYFLATHIKRLHASEDSLQKNLERLNQSKISLRVSETKFIGMFQYSPVPLSVIRLRDGHIFEVNDSWLAQFGFDREQCIGNTLLSLQLWSNENAHQSYVELLSRQEYIERHAVEMRHKNGYILFCLLSARLFDSGGEKMVIVSPIDVTHQREIEHEVRELNAQLEQRVLSRTAKLVESNAELGDALDSLKSAQGELLRSEKMAALGSLVAGVAHELNTPIGNSVTVASTLEEWVLKMSAELSSPKPSRTLLASGVAACVVGTEILRRNLERAAELVMSFKQVAVDQSSNQRRSFDLRQSIEEVLLTLGPMYMKTPYRLEQHLAPNISMNSYPGALGQIVTNFVANALAHAFEGKAKGIMRIETRMNGDQAELIFSDDGVGIPEQFQVRVFDPFFTTKLGQGGSGLGMHIVYNLVNGVLGGKIALTSTLGSGTQICVTLPLEAKIIGEEAYSS